MAPSVDYLRKPIILAPSIRTTPMTGKVKRKTRRVSVHRLHKPEGVRQELTRVYRAARRSEIDTLDASRLCSILWTIYRVLEGTDLERRLEALERHSGFGS